MSATETALVSDNNIASTAAASAPAASAAIVTY
jgi:hypothetical protein